MYKHYPFFFLFCFNFIIFSSWLLKSSSAYSNSLQYTIKKEDKECIRSCGQIQIPYPFGLIGSNADCFYNHYFALTCNSSSRTLLLNKLNLQVLSITITFGIWAGDLVAKAQIISACGGPTGNSTGVVEARGSSIKLEGSPFSYSYKNVFATVGCNGYAVMGNEKGQIVAGCSSVCSPQPSPKHGSSSSFCDGFGCCKTEVGDGFKHYTVGVTVSNGSRNCRSAFLISDEYLQNSTVSLLASDITNLPVVLSWDVNQLFPHHKGEQSGPAYVFTIVFLIIILPCIGAIILTCAFFWACWLYRTRSRRKDTKLRAKYFKMRLEEQSIVDRQDVEKIKLFMLKQLKKATNNFHKNRVLGQGGQGTVYKGMLTNGNVIAVKKSNALDETKWKEFINEVILLSQIRHRHVVKLLGCCLETKKPLVVYEFIPNGTLFQHLHNPNKECELAWEVRLRIAAEIATAIAYLHFDSPTPIYHRDIKSSNILLDGKFTAKLSDFGISKAFSAGQTHLTTNVQGTLGYLDPEYFYFNQFSEKSDVYSFGAVLVEILTGKPPNHLVGEEEEDEKVSIVEYFMSSIMNDSDLYEILDPIVGESNAREEIMGVAKLARECLNPRGIQRPTMKEVATVLKGLNNGGNYQVIESDEISTPMETRGNSSSRDSTLQSMKICSLISTR